MLLVSVYTPEHTKTSGLLMFSGGFETTSGINGLRKSQPRKTQAAKM